VTAWRAWRSRAVVGVVMLSAAALAGAVRDDPRTTVMRTWYPNGQPRDERSYRGGLEHGNHRGWWEDGTPRFDATYVRGSREGTMWEWNRAGMLFHLGHYQRGTESGSQQMWNDDGSLRANYVVRDGRRYGYMGAVGCTPSDSTDRPSSADKSAGGTNAAGR